MPKGPPRITAALIEFIEIEYKREGYESGGARILVVSEHMATIATNMKASVGTVKNTLAYLHSRGYILSYDLSAGLYLRLSMPGVLSPKGGDAQPPPEELSEVLEPEDTGDITEENLLAEEFRLPRETVTAIARDIARKRGVRDALAFVDAHRSWCRLNRVAPFL